MDFKEYCEYFETRSKECDQMICFAWWGFPQYAARCVGKLVDAANEKVCVVATRPAVPVEGMEALCKCKVVWIEPDSKAGIVELLGDIPRVIFTSGWAIPAFNRLVAETKRAGGRAIAMVDNNFEFSFKEVLKSLRFRLLFRSRYDGYFVPGKSGEKLMRFYGVKSNLVERGMYAADEGLFRGGKPLKDRPRRIVYIGQFIMRKNVLSLAKAFLEATRDDQGGWELHLYGSGPLKGDLEKFSGARVKVHSFAQPEDLPDVYRNARALCLPSCEEHWGLVVHEAALCGCFLLLSNKVGSADDLLSENVNGISFETGKYGAICKALNSFMNMDDAALDSAWEESLRLAGHVTLESFARGALILSGS